MYNIKYLNIKLIAYFKYIIIIYNPESMVHLIFMCFFDFYFSLIIFSFFIFLLMFVYDSFYYLFLFLSNLNVILSGIKLDILCRFLSLSSDDILPIYTEDSYRLTDSHS